MMRNAVQQCGGHFGITKNLHPFTEFQVGGYNERSAFIQLADQVKQERTT